jgi:two-component system LytT family sensor kinase
MALLATVESYVSQLAIEKPVSWSLALGRSLKDWYTCGVLSLGVLWFCRINKLRPGKTGRWVVAHLGGAVLFFLTDVTITSLLLTGERSVQNGETLTFIYLVRKLAIHYVVMCLLMYWFVVVCHEGWHYYQSFRERELHAAELQHELVEAKLAALRMQLNPHFLFNTLHAVSALIHENPDAADRVLVRLSELLRLTLDQSRPQEVALSEEIAFLEGYLEIEQTRFSDRLQIERNVEPETSDALVPFLILQPLVENAIRHGIEPREGIGRLSIRASRSNGTLQLRVTDNGGGLTGGAVRPGEGIGLSNTRSRLRHLYGENYRLELVPAEGGGLEARIDLPFKTRENVASDLHGS